MAVAKGLQPSYFWEGIVARAGRVTAIKEQTRNRDRVNIYLEERYAFSLSWELAAGIKEGTFLSAREAEDLLRQDEVAKAYQKALRLLSYRPRSRREVLERLKTKGVAEEVLALVLDRLSQAGLLDDLAFALWWIENREGFRPRSRSLLRYELRRKGVEEETIVQALEGIDETESARRAAQARLSRYAHLDEDTFRKKLSQFLMRRGFSYSVIREVVGNLVRDRQESS